MVAVILAGFLIIAAALILTASSILTSQTAEDHFELPLSPGGMEARYVPGHSLGDILRADVETAGGDGGGVRIYVGERRAFREMLRALEDGADPGDIAEAEDGMLFAGDGPELKLDVKLSDSRYLVGALNRGPGNCTMWVDLIIRPQPQYITICFSIPVILLAVAASWAVVREGGARWGRRPPPPGWYPEAGGRPGYGHEEWPGPGDRYIRGHREGYSRGHREGHRGNGERKKRK